MQEEVWKDVVGYEGLYQVSNFGRVKHVSCVVATSSDSARSIKERIIKPHLQNKGYFLVDLYKNNKRKEMLVHRLVADAFIPNPLDLPCVNHKDSNPVNCRVENLEWCTVSYNAKYSYDNNNRRDKMNWKHGKDNTNSKAVCAIDKNGDVVFCFDCIMDAERETGILNSNIVACLKGRHKTAGGYIWIYAE